VPTHDPTEYPTYFQELYSYSDLTSDSRCLMVIGVNETFAGRLKVWDMESFVHPGGFSIMNLHTCKKIHCTWHDASAQHIRIMAQDSLTTNDIYFILKNQGAAQLGYLNDTECDGSDPRVGCAPWPNTASYSCHVNEMDFIEIDASMWPTSETSPQPEEFSRCAAMCQLLNHDGCCGLWQGQGCWFVPYSTWTYNSGDNGFSINCRNNPEITPTLEPTISPTRCPTDYPSQTPSLLPTFLPTSSPTSTKLICTTHHQHMKRIPGI